MVIKITGKVISSGAKEGIKGLRVEAWDKDLLVSDLVGATATGDGGIFRIQFDESYFKELFLDRRPDLFVKVFRGDKLIKSTEDSVLWNVDREDIEMTIEVEDSEGAITPEVVSSKGVETRSILQATYTPRKPKPEESLAKVSRGLEKGAFLSYLAPSHEELDELTQRYTKELEEGAVETTAKNKDLKTTAIISAAISKTGRINVLRSAKQFATLEVDTLCRVAQDLVGLREAALGTISEAHKTIIEEYTKALPPEEAAPPTPGTTVKDLMDWAIKNNVEIKSAHKTIELGKTLSFKLQKIELNDFKALASRRINRLRNTVAGCEESLATEHIGYLHLERMGFTPAGIERGRLVYSVPLSPGEEVNIRQREWSRTSEEFERIVTDYLEEFSEEGVTEKTELAQSVDSQKQHSNAFNTAVSASGEAYGFSIQASVGYNASESASKSEQITRNRTRELTSKASSRSKQEHKISFRVASARETEDETVQRIKNPFPDRATRVDYYQLMRKWQVDLYRYGIRLTYDIAIPEPGSGLLSKIQEINRIRTKLEEEFQFPLALEATPEGYIILDDDNYIIEASKYGAFVEKPPLATDEKVVYDTHDWATEEGGYKKTRFYSIEVTVPEDYIIDGIVPVVAADGRPSGNLIFCIIRLKAGKDELYYYKILFKDDGSQDEEEIAPYSEENPYRDFDGRSGTLRFSVYERNITIQHIEVTVIIKRRSEIYEAWRLKAFNTIRDAALSQYYENRQKLKERLSRLQEELGAQDALSLRKKEREEVMKGVLRYLFPISTPPCSDDFEFFPDTIFKTEDIDEDRDIELVLYELETTGLIKDECFRRDLLAHGEMIKFLHHAIEWENMLYFLYPYFWTHPRRWELKKYLEHPDPMHRAFLKAGSARVVLTIRPGFENAFLAFINTGDMNDLPSSPYLEIGQEFRNYANTNYPGIPPANPVENFRPLLTHKQKNAWRIMQLHIRLLELFYRTNRRYPSTNEGLSAIRQVFPIKDPWGNDYVYTCPGQPEHGPYDLASYGADGALGGSGENADIANWDDSPIISGTPKQVQAWDDIQLIPLLLDAYYEVHGCYPSTAEGLEKLKELIPLKDPWDRDYVYTCPGVHADYELVCYGANGVPGGEGEDADITSWAEASLIGQWFEYTPTSALDIAFDEEMPSK